MKHKLLDKDRYTEPDAVYEHYTETLPAWNVRRGDVIGGTTVAEQKKGTKWMELRSESGRLITRCLRTDELVVTRERLTEESRELIKRYDQNMRLVKNLFDWAPSAPARVNAIVKAVKDYGRADYGQIQGLMEAQAEDRLIATFRAVVEHQNKEGFEGDLVELWEGFKNEMKDRFISDHRHRAISRSSNLLANLIEDCDREAEANFLSWHYRWTL